MGCLAISQHPQLIPGRKFTFTTIQPITYSSRYEGDNYLLSVMKKLIAGLAVAAMTMVSQPVSARGQANPYTLVVVGTAINVCMVRYGYFTSEKAVDVLFKWARTKGLEPYQVSNLMDHPDFDDDLESAITNMGGCQSVVARVTKDKSERMKGLSSGSSDAAVEIYDDAVLRNQLFKEKQLYQPNIKKGLAGS